MKRILILVTVCAVGCAALFFAQSGDRRTFTFRSDIEASESPSTLEPGVANHHQEDWPQWRGAQRDGIAASTGLLHEWPADGPPLLWQVHGLGAGMSSVAVANGSLFTIGQRDGKVWLISRRAEDGSEQWSTELGSGGQPNGTPTVNNDHVFAVSREGKVVCADVATGSLIWTRDFVADFNGSVPTWGYSESPLVEQDRVICTPGSPDALVVALDRRTGRTIWKCPTPDQMRNKGHSGAGYSSPVISHAAGVHQYVQMFGGGVIGVAAADGTSLWGYSGIANSTAVIPTPIVHDDLVFVSSGYGTGAALLKITRKNTGLSPEEVYFHRGRKVQNHHGGMILLDGHVYMGHGHNQGHPLCLELLTGSVKWGPERGPGSGSAAVVLADGHLYFRYENARMALVEASPLVYRLKSDFDIPSRLGKSWPHPAIAHKRLYLRDQDVLLCYDLAK